ncbi:MAG: pre-peptidase C-terminal domain-containing protein, partial [Planctomycetales bacterium]|nr:pre-peptidase C-terminal domain-containing protein [Planctomycetales bacterium]
MTLRRPRSIVTSFTKQHKQRQRDLQRRFNRKLLTEQLEDRRLLAGPELIAIRPDEAALLQNADPLQLDTLTSAPREINLLFKGGADLKETTIANSVRLVRSGGDGIFGNANDVVVKLGYVGLNDPGDIDAPNLQSIVMRPASPAAHNATDSTVGMPDDVYQIEIDGLGANALTNRANEAFTVDGTNPGNFTQKFQLARGAQIVAVVPQPVSRNEHQVTFSGTVTGGQFTLTLNNRVTQPINATGGDVRQFIETALYALPNVQDNDIVVRGPASGGPWFIELQGQFAGEEPTLGADASGLAGSNTGLSVVRTNELTQSNNQIIVYFSDAIGSAVAEDPKYYQLVYTAASAETNDDRILLPSRVTYDQTNNKAVLTFDASIPDGTYRLDVGFSDEDNNSLLTAINVGTQFDARDFSYLGYLGDDAGTNNHGGDVDLYRVLLKNGTTLTVNSTPEAAFDVAIELLDKDGNVIGGLQNTGADGVTETLVSGAISAATPEDEVHYIRISSGTGTSTGSYLLETHVTNAVATSDTNTSIADATDLGVLGAVGIFHAAQIEPQSIALPPLPGGTDEPGHREIQAEAHIGASGTEPVVPDGIRVIDYQFPKEIGTDPSGAPYLNLITDEEKDIVRSIFEIYAGVSGLEFRESEVDGFVIAKGDLRAADPGIGPNSGVGGLGGPGFVILNNSVFNQANREYGDGFTGTMFHEIGHSLGLGHAYDVPSVQGAALPNDVLPGDNDVVHLQRIEPPDSTDIDLYQFEITENGTLSAQTFAERLDQFGRPSSTLDSVLTLYRQTGTAASPDIVLVSRNDNYYGNDPYLNIELTPGIYYIGVTSTGNTQYDPRVSDSGFGGTTDGDYDLQLDFKANRDGALRDIDGTDMDGDADGTPGGIFNFWFESSSQTIFVDKANNSTAGFDGVGSLADPYDTLSVALARASDRVIVPGDLWNAISDGDRFVVDDGINEFIFEFDTLGDGVVAPAKIVDLSTTAPTSAEDVAAAIRTAIITEFAGSVTVTPASGPTTVLNLGGIADLDVSLTPPLISAPNVVRVVGSSGLDQDITTLEDNDPYLLGTTTGGADLADGPDFLVPQGTTVMVQGGALFKLRKANLDAGTSADSSRSNAALQILGTPDNPVWFRSYHNNAIGSNTDVVGQTAGSGDFGGIVFRADSDLQDRGITLNYVNHADINNGGGKVFVDSVEQVFTPVHLIDARPTISFNHISNSDAAAISASPNSFDDRDGRIGPDIHGNFLLGSTIDGLFIRIETDLGSTVDKLEVPGRFNDTDITHVLTENLQIAGQPGGPLVTAERQTLSIEGGVPTSGTFTLQFTDHLGIMDTTAPIQWNAEANTRTNRVDRLRAYNTGTSTPASSGTFRLTFGGSTGSTTLRFDATAAEVRAALLAFGGISSGDVQVTGTRINSAAGVTIEWTGNYAGSLTIPTLSISGSGNTVAPAASGPAVSNIAMVIIPVQEHLENLSNIFNGEVTVTGGPLPGNPMTITFQGARLSAIDLPTIVISVNALSVGAPVINDLFNPATSDVFSDGAVTGRPAGRLVIDPGVVIKLGGARIEAERGSASLIAEGTLNSPVVFTSIGDDRFGGSGSFDVNRNGVSVGQPGDWSGLFFGEETSGSIDNAFISFGGGDSPIEGTDANFNAIEIHQADVRIANSVLKENANGNASSIRNGRGANQAATIYVRGAQPVIVDNIIEENAGSAININANALRFENLRDYGRSTGPADAFDQFDDNHGPLIRLNRLANNTINGMLVRGEVLTTQSIWDDTDIVHVLQSEITVENLHTYSGLRLQSTNSESLVVKLSGGTAGFTATGKPLDIIDRVGGTLQILGTVGHPVVFTDLADDTVGAGFTPDGLALLDTNNNGPSVGVPGRWRGLLFDEFSNDRNVAIVRESEDPFTDENDVNANPTTAQLLGTLAPDMKSGDESSRLGFEVHGVISPDDPTDIDVYSFTGTAGTEVWFDIDRTDPALDLVIELINSSQTVLARAYFNHTTGQIDLSGIARPLAKEPLLGGDFYSQNFRDAGMRLTLPTTGTHYIRVRSNPPVSSGITAIGAGESRGEYQLQVRMQQIDEFPGSTVRFADIRYAQTGIDVRGLPAHSFLTGDAGETESGNDFDNADVLVNLLQTDAAALNIEGILSSETDVDWFRFDLDHTDIQVIPGVNDSGGTVSVVFDLDYADGAVRADSTIAVFNSRIQAGVLVPDELVFIGRESNVEDDQPAAGQAPDIDDLTRGSLGNKDPFIGPVHLPVGNSASHQAYWVAVMSDRQIPTDLTATFLSSPGSPLVRLEPINTVRRIVEDHIAVTRYNAFTQEYEPFYGYRSQGSEIAADGGLFGTGTTLELDTHIKAFSFADVTLFVSTDNPTDGGGDHLFTINPFTGGNFVTRVDTSTLSGGDDIQDIVIRTDGAFYGYRELSSTTSAGELVQINTNDPANLVTVVGGDNIRHPAGNTVFQTTQTSPNNVGNTGVLFADLSQDFDASENNREFEAAALTFFRRNNNPDYYAYYAVTELDDRGRGAERINSKLYRAREDGSASPDRGTDGYGIRDDIQPAGVTYAAWNITFDGDDDTDNAVIRIESKIPGAAGNAITVDVSKADQTFSVTASLTALTIDINLDTNPATTAQQLVDQINAQAGTFVTAAVINGPTGETVRDSPGATGGFVSLGTDPGGAAYSATMGVDGTPMPTLGLAGPITGRVTGLAFNDFSAGTLFGVTDAGELLLINSGNGDVTKRFDLAAALPAGYSTNFQGLTLGPQNVELGRYANMLFAITSDGYMYAIDSDAAEAVTDVTAPGAITSILRAVFDTDGDGLANVTDGGDADTLPDGIRSTQISTGNINNFGIQDPNVSGTERITGLAFSPLDFNLWHLTTNRGTDAGHGINDAPDDSRDPRNSVDTVFDAAWRSAGSNHFPDEFDGGASFYFGFEPQDDNITSTDRTYFGAPNSFITDFNTTAVTDPSATNDVRVRFSHNPQSLKLSATQGFSFVTSSVATVPVTVTVPTLVSGGTGFIIGNVTITIANASAPGGPATAGDLVSAIEAYMFTATGSDLDGRFLTDFMGIDIVQGDAASDIGSLASSGTRNFVAAANAQYGIIDTRVQNDLSTNSEIVNTYNFAGGAFGTLSTNAFSLDGYSDADRPTLYFNYYLDTENDDGAEIRDNDTDPFRDSARVFISRDGGTTWDLLVTNNSQMSDARPQFSNFVSGSQDAAELPGFISHLADAGLNSTTPRPANHQQIQRLFEPAVSQLSANINATAGTITVADASDFSAATPFTILVDSEQMTVTAVNFNSRTLTVTRSSGVSHNSGARVEHVTTRTWRQARVDLSEYAGEADLQLRFDFSTAGTMNDPSLNNLSNLNGTPRYGEWSDDARSIRSYDNQHEGFYIDDIIVGFAERGEMVTNASGSKGITNLFATPRTTDADPNQNPDILNGPYQLEIRRSGEYAGLNDDGTITIGTIFDTNDRHIVETDPALTQSDGFEGTLFTYDTNPLVIRGVTQTSDAAWDPTSTANPQTGAHSVQAGTILDGQESILTLTLSDVIGGDPAAGAISFAFSVESEADSDGLRFYIDGVPQILPHDLSDDTTDLADETFATGVVPYHKVTFSFGSGEHIFSWVYSKDATGSFGLDTAFVDNIVILQGGTGLLGDRNRARAQGQFIIDSNFITDSSIRGINVQAGTDEAGGNVPHPGSVINFPQLSSDNLVPGIVIQNNVIADSAGIRFAGHSGANPERPIPFGKIVNNTLVGNAGAGFGVDVAAFASPTILNNLFSEFGTAIRDNGTGTVIRSNFFQENTSNGVVGTDEIIVVDSPVGSGNFPALFVDAANGNFYPAAGSDTVDSSLNTLQDRFNFVNFKDELGIPPSPVFAPDRDVYGQLRVDSVENPLGGGSDIFKDRGAIDRADGDDPFAELLIPVDNDAEGVDADPNDTIVNLRGPFLETISILLGDGPGPNSPFEGTGVDPATVQAATVSVTRNRQQLVSGVDYTFGYDANSDILLLTPLSTLWQPNSVYVVTFDNTVIADLAGNTLRSNQEDGSTKFTIILGEFDFDYGDARDDLSYGTTLGNDGARHVLIPDNPNTPVDESVRFGTRVDGETDGQPNVVAAGDDRDQAIVIDSVATPQLTTTSLAPFTLSIPDPASIISNSAIVLDDGTNTQNYVFANSGRLFAILNDGSNQIVEIDVATGTAIGGSAIPTPQTVTASGNVGLAFDGTSLWFIQNDAVLPKVLFELDPTDGSVLDSYPLTAGIQTYSGLTALGPDIYVVDQDESDIYVLDRTNRALRSLLDIDGLNSLSGLDRLDGGLAGLAGGLSQMPGQDQLVATSQNGKVYFINPTTGLIEDTFDSGLGTAIDGAAVVDGEIYLGHAGGIRVMDLQENIIGNFGTGNFIALGSDGGFAPLSNATFIDLSTVSTADELVNALVAAIQSDLDAGELAGFTPSNLGGGQLYLGGLPILSVTTPAGSGIAAVSNPVGAAVEYRLGLTPHFELEVADNGSGVADVSNGQSFTMNDGNGTAITFTFEQVSALASDATAGTTTIHVLDGTAFPSVGSFNVRIGTEEVTVTANTPTGTANEANLTVVRGVNGTEAVAHLTGDLATDSDLPLNAILFTSSDTPAQVAGAIDGALQQAFAEFDVSSTGAIVTILGTRTSATLDATTTTLIQRGPASDGTDLIADGSTFTIDDGLHLAVTFEFDVAGSPPTQPGNIAIPLSLTSSIDQIGADVVAAINPQIQSIILSSLDPEYLRRGEPLAPAVYLGSGLIQIGVRPEHSVEITGGSPGLEFAGKLPVRLQTTGVGLAIQVPRTQAILTPANGAAGIREGDTFTIDDGINFPVTFEFNKVLGSGVAFGHRVIELSDDPTNTSQSQLNARILAVLQAATDTVTGYLSPDILPQLNTAGNGIEIEGADTGLVVTPQAGSGLGHQRLIADGATFQLSDAQVTPIVVDFEFVSTVPANTASLIQIQLAEGDTPNVIASKIRAAIELAVGAQTPLTGFAPIELTEAIVELRASSMSRSFDPMSSGLSFTGSAGGIHDGQTFAVRRGTEVLTFEFDRNNQLSAVSNIRVDLGDLTAIPPSGSISTVASDALYVATAIESIVNSVVPTISARAFVDGANAVVDLQGDDEDGISVGKIFVPTQAVAGYQIPIEVVMSAPGLVDAWIDFNGNGQFTPEEKLFDPAFAAVQGDSLSLPAGRSILMISPSDYTANVAFVPGLTYARFRVSQDGGLFPTGLGIGGETEDYLVRVLSNTAPGIANQPDPGILTFDEDDATFTLNLLDVDNDPSLTTGGGLNPLFDDADLHSNREELLSYQVLSNSNESLVTVNLIGTDLVFDFHDDQNINLGGPAVVVVEVTDHAGLKKSATLTVNVNAVNDAPVVAVTNNRLFVDEGTNDGTGNLATNALALATTLSSDVTAGTTSITVESTAVLPTPTPFYIQIGLEQLRVTKVDGNILTFDSPLTSGYLQGEAVLSSVTAVTDVDEEELVRTQTSTILLDPAAGGYVGSGPLTVQSVAGLPTAFPFDIRIGAEELRVTGNPSGNTLTVTRGVNGTQASAHAVGESVGLLTNGLALTTGLAAATPLAVETFAFTDVSDFGTPNLSNLPAVPFQVRIEDELLTVTNIVTSPGSGANLTNAMFTVVRGVNGMSPSHLTGTLMELPGLTELVVTLSLSDGDGTDGNDGTISLTAPVGSRVAVINNGTGVVTIQGTEEDVNATLATLAYTVPSSEFNRLNNAHATNPNGDVYITVHATDLGNTGGAPLVNVATVTVTVEPINDAPTISIPNDIATVLEEDDAAGLFLVGSTFITVNDVDEPDDVNTELQVTLSVQHGGLTIDLISGGATIASVAADDDGQQPLFLGTLQSVTIQGTIAQLNAALTTLLYFGDEDFNSEAIAETLTIVVNDLAYTDKDTLSHTASDAKALTTTTTLDLTVLPVNDAPGIDVSAGTLSASSLTVEEDVASGLGIVGIRLSDLADDLYDPDDVVVNVTLSVLHGGLTIDETNLVRVTSTLADADSMAPDAGNVTGSFQSVTLQGTIAALNTALDTLVYYNDADFNTEMGSNAETLTILVEDLGNTDYQTDGTPGDGTTTLSTTSGGGTELTAMEMLSLTVLPTNDAPVIDVSGVTSTPANLTVAEDDASGLQIDMIRVFEDADDVYDPDDVVVNVTLSVLHGGLTIDETNLVRVASALADADSVAPDAGNVTGSFQSITLQGTIANLNTALDTLVYYSDQDFNTEILPANAETLTILVEDLGNTDYQTDGTPGDGTTTLSLTSGGATELTATETLSLTVLPVNDAPGIDVSAGTLSASSLTVEEDGASGLGIVGIRLSDLADDLYDPDDVVVNVTL